MGAFGENLREVQEVARCFQEEELTFLRLWDRLCFRPFTQIEFSIP